jgi:hypothetical protein
MEDPVKFMMFATAATSAVVIVKVIANTVLRAAELARRPAGVDENTIRERLERIEIAVDTIAIEVERLGEHQRFNAQLALNRPEPLPSKVVTPH